MKVHALYSHLYMEREIEAQLLALFPGFQEFE